jgi:hypothetical protein
VGLTTLPPSCVDCQGILRTLTSYSPRACPGLYRDYFTLLNICGFSEWYLLPVTLLALRIRRWLLDVWNIYAPWIIAIFFSTNVFIFIIIFTCIICLMTLSTTRLHSLRVLDEIMRVEHWWNDTDGGKPKYSMKKLYRATLSYTNPTPIGPETNHLCCGLTINGIWPCR